MEFLGPWGFIAIIVAIFFAPTWIAITGRKEHPFGIFLANIIMKPTINSWLFVLYMAMNANTRRR